MRKRLLKASCACTWAVSALAAGCTHGHSVANPASTTDAASTGATTTTDAPTTTTLVVVDPVTPPPTIDLAYVNAVMAELALLEVSRTELVLNEHRVSAQAQRLARAEYVGKELGLAYEDMAMLARRPQPDFRRPVGPDETTAARLLSNSSSCLSFVGTDDNSLIVTDPTTSNVAVALVRKDPAVDSSTLNRTPWVIKLIFAERPPKEPQGDPCLA